MQCVYNKESKQRFKGQKGKYLKGTFFTVK